MQEPPKPANETERLAALRALGVLDTPPEQRFNRITRTAARVFQVPIALVSLVDADRQWFKSRYGLHVSETPRSVSFCGHAILQDRAMVIEDALLDPRFADNPVVSGPPHVRFYAGQPLSGAGGVKLGTLCIIDHQPRQFSANDRLTLADMGGWVERELHLDTEQNAARARLNSVLDSVSEAVLIAAGDGSIDTMNDTAARLFGYDAHELVGEPMDKLLPAPAQQPDEAGILQRLQKAPQWSERASLDWTAQRKDGSRFAATAAITDFYALGRRMYTLSLRERG
ncbi:MAG: PAS domain S-box protein [Burkholderiales bacterium]|nr:PAS domain S-box protein [Burkholderiales bacterium]